jgi:hypothetical protein
MLPSPTQPPPVQTTTPLPQLTPPKVEQPVTREYHTRRRAGETPVARGIKAILRPILKLLYFILSWIKNHKIVALLALILLVGSVFLTSYFTTGFPAQPNAVQQNLTSTPQLSPNIAAWLGALQTGDGATMINMQKSISASTKQPDSAIYILQFGEKQAQMKWTSASVDSIKPAADGAIDTFIEISMTSTASTTNGTKLLTFWHFVTAPGGQILQIENVSTRQVG